MTLVDEWKSSISSIPKSPWVTTNSHRTQNIWILSPTLFLHILYLKGITANGHTNHIIPSICLLWQYNPIVSNISNPMFVCQSFKNQWVLGMLLSGTVLDQQVWGLGLNTQHHQYRVTDRKLDLLNALAPRILQNKTYAPLTSANYQLPKLPQLNFQAETSSSTLQVQVKSSCYFSRCTTVGPLLPISPSQTLIHIILPSLFSLCHGPSPKLIPPYSHIIFFTIFNFPQVVQESSCSFPSNIRPTFCDSVPCMDLENLL